MTDTTLERKFNSLPPNDPRRAWIQDILAEPSGAALSDERLLTLKDAANELGYHPTWLSKLGVPQRCGHRIAGRRRYRTSEVLLYLGSAECQAVLAERRRARRAKEISR